jgi:hypothetical protein
MGELVKAFQKFLMRDLSYIIGGSAVILSFLYAFDRLPGESTSTFWYVLGLAFAYVVGYAIQDALGVLRIIRMKAAHTPNKLARYLYKLYDRKYLKESKSFPEAEYKRGKDWLYTSAPQRYKDDHERIEGLKQVAFTVGPCLLISGILVLTRDCPTTAAFDRAVSYASLAIGVVLYFLGWLKVTQQAQYVLHHDRESRRRTFRRGTKGRNKVRRT